MKENPPGLAAGDASTGQLREAANVPFTIAAVRRVAFGAKAAEFAIITSLGVIYADLFMPEGRAPFVQARSVRDKFTGQWRRTVALDRTFAARVLDALRERPSPNVRRTQQERQVVEPSAVLLESEQRFDAAFGSEEAR